MSLKVSRRSHSIVARLTTFGGDWEIAALIATQPSDLPAQPIGFIGETVRAIDSFQCVVALEHIEANAPLELAQTDRTKMQRAAIAFGQMI